MRLRTSLLVLSLLVSSSAFAVDHAVSVGPANVFTPSTLNINVGDRVIWTRQGGIHNVQANDGSFSNGEPNGSWTTFQHTFNASGSFGYHCTAHGSPTAGMRGTVNVAGGGGGTPGTVSFTGNATRSVNEGAGNLSITVQRTGGDDGAISVQYETVNNGTADTPSDYIQTNGTINWADNDDDNKSFNVPIVNDSAIEGNETFSIQLISPGGGATLGSPNVLNVTIVDNDSDPGSPGTLRFTSSTRNASESDASVQLTVERVGGSTGAVAVDYATANGTATSGSDYVTTNGTLSWGSGDSANKSFQVPIVGDSVEESSETFTATLSSPTGGASIGSPSTSTVTIADDDITCVPCVADATTLCLAGGSGDPNRFRVRVTWTDFEGGSGPGMAVPYTPDSGFFWFFNADNLEYLSKIVNGCGSPFDAYWFFYAAATNLGLETEVLDTTACVLKTYSNPLGNFASDGDIAALPTCAANPAAAVTAPASAATVEETQALLREHLSAGGVSASALSSRGVEPRAAAEPARALEPLAGEGECLPCVADATTLCLAGGSGDPNRFQVKVTWTDFEGGSGPGMAVPYTPDSGFFWFFNAANLEYLSKIVNGCGSPFDAFWFFYAAATNLELRTEVIDTTACVTTVYENPLGNFASDGDIAALPTCAALATVPE